MINIQHKCILVVEDDDMSFIYINQILSLTNCDIMRVKTGIDAIDFFRSGRKPDLILLDIQLPDMDGRKVASTIRNDDTGIPIIAQTASQIGNEKEQLLQAGCNDVITKPFSIDELLEVLKKHFR